MQNLKIKNYNEEKIVEDLYSKIEKIILENKEKIVYQVNNTLVNTYFNIGKIIVENEQKGNIQQNMVKKFY